MKIEFADKDTMLKSMKVYLGYLYKLSNEPIIPYNFLGVAEAFEIRTSELVDKYNHILDLSSAKKHAIDFKEKVLQLNDKIKDVRERIDSNYNWSNDETVKTLNKCILRLSRILTPVSSTIFGKYGQDDYGLPALKSFIPGLHILEDMNKIEANSDRYKVLYTKAVREKNKVLDALIDATEFIDMTIKLITR